MVVVLAVVEVEPPLLVVAVALAAAVNLVLVLEVLGILLSHLHRKVITEKLYLAQVEAVVVLVRQAELMV